eukprot:scpid87762/ scgid35168/ Nicotinamidase; Nicotine deamidase
MEVIKRKSALIIVDVQNDFISGSLAVPGGEKVVDVCNHLRDRGDFSMVVVTQDWHPSTHISFARNAQNFVLADEVDGAAVCEFSTVSFSDPPLDGVSVFPVHCVADTWGAELHKDLQVRSSDVTVRKGSHTERESFSAFADNTQLSETHLANTLRHASITDVFVCGLAYDVCVSWTARDAVRRGFRTFFVEDAAAGVEPGEMSRMKQELAQLGVSFVQSDEVPGLLAEAA